MKHGKGDHEQMLIDLVAGLLIILLSLPRGTIRERYGGGLG